MSIPKSLILLLHILLPEKIVLNTIFTFNNNNNNKNSKNNYNNNDNNNNNNSRSFLFTSF